MSSQEDEDEEDHCLFLMVDITITPPKPNNSLTQCTTNGNGTKLLLQSSWSGVDVS